MEKPHIAKEVAQPLIDFLEKRGEASFYGGLSRMTLQESAKYALRFLYNGMLAMGVSAKCNALVLREVLRYQRYYGAGFIQKLLEDSVDIEALTPKQRQQILNNLNWVITAQGYKNTAPVVDMGPAGLFRVHEVN